MNNGNIFIRAWAKDIRPKKGPPSDLIKSSNYDIDLEITVVRSLNREDLTLLRRQSETDDIHFLRDMHWAIKDVFEDGQVDPVIRRTGLCFDFLLPASRASDALLGLEDVYYRRWLPKHGPRIARLIFAVQGAGTIWGFWGPRMTKLVVGALGLHKLFGWVSGLRGG